MKPPPGVEKISFLFANYKLGTASLYKKVIITLFFKKYAENWRKSPKLTKIAENCDQNIDPRTSAWHQHQGPGAGSEDAARNVHHHCSRSADAADQVRVQLWLWCRQKCHFRC
jgi:hypothetical protein